MVLRSCQTGTAAQAALAAGRESVVMMALWTQCGFFTYSSCVQALAAARSVAHTLPPSTPTFVACRELEWRGLEGTIAPDGWADLPNLQVLNLCRNSLTGTLPNGWELSEGLQVGSSGDGDAQRVLRSCTTTALQHCCQVILCQMLSTALDSYTVLTRSHCLCRPSS